jgi:drug/metabolite transporter (DMT)-like permease
VGVQTLKRGSTSGILFMIAATQVVPLMDGFAKYLSPRYSAWQLTWARFFVHLLVLAPVVLLKFGPRDLWPQKPMVQLARGAFLAVATVLFFAAIATIPIADALALLFGYPLLVTVLSPLVLGEKVAARSWVAVAIGFVGILVILRPGFVALEWGSLLSIAAGGAYAAYFLATRRVSGTAHPLVTLAYTGVPGAIGLSIVAPAYWVPPRLEDLPLLAGIGLSAGLGHFLLILAFERAPASVLAPLGYAEIVMATAIGYFVFGDFPDRWTWIGIAIVVASGTYVLIREKSEAEPPA